MLRLKRRYAWLVNGSESTITERFEYHISIHVHVDLSKRYVFPRTAHLKLSGTLSEVPQEVQYPLISECAQREDGSLLQIETW